MFITVRESPLKPPLLQTNQATWAEIRDEEGWLVFVLIFPPGKATVLTIAKDDAAFVETIKSFSIPQRVDPKLMNPEPQ